MADVVVSQTVHLTVTDQEWRLIMRALALFAGLKIRPKDADRELAAELNQHLLKQRRAVLKQQFEQADAALHKAIEGEMERVIGPGGVDASQEKEGGEVVGSREEGPA